jgi:hypothetical protein
MPLAAAFAATSSEGGKLFISNVAAIVPQANRPGGIADLAA